MSLKRVIVILFVLCPCLVHGTLFAQIHMTSSANYRSYTTSGGLLDPPPVEFRSTSTYGNTISRRKAYSTAPMYVANGSVRTVASSLKGGVSLQNQSSSSEYENTVVPIVPGVPDTPLGFGWDVMLLFGIFAIIYVLWVRRRCKA